MPKLINLYKSKPTSVDIMSLVDEEFNNLIKQANKVYLDNFPQTTNFERALFFSWYCEIRDCKFCYMSTQPKDEGFKKIGRRKKVRI